MTTTSQKPNCLHIPRLAEGSVAFPYFKEEGYEQYELDCVFDEGFETASVGLAWEGMDEAEGLFHYAEMGTWQDFEAQQARGRPWHSLDCLAKSWEEADAQEHTWTVLAMHPAMFLYARGVGKECPGPEQGLDWDSLDTLEHSWAALDDKAFSWKLFEQLLPTGLTWTQWGAAFQSWQQFEEDVRSWKELETRLARGLSWNSFDARYRSWQERDEELMSWEDFENQMADTDTHRCLEAPIPKWHQSLRFRLRGSKENGTTSEYLTSTRQEIVVQEEAIETVRQNENSFQLNAQQGQNPNGVQWVFAHDGWRLDGNGKFHPSLLLQTHMQQKAIHPYEMQLSCGRPVTGDLLWSGAMGRWDLAKKQMGEATVTLERTNETETRVV